MLTYGFYNSVNGDRTYNAEQMSSIFEGILHDGVFEDIDDKLMVEATTGMNIKVGAGRAWFDNTWTKNDSDILLTVDSAETVLKRIDVVVLEVNSSVEVRENSIKIVKGTPASSPVAPTLTNTEYIHQYPLAEIFVDASVVEIVSDDITNKIGTDDCPYVKGILRNIDTVAVDTILANFEDLSEEVETNRTYFDANIGQTVNKTSIITTTGSNNAYITTYSQYIPSVYTGMIVIMNANFSNTGASTINVNSLGAKTIKKITSSGLSDLSSGDIISGGTYTLYYDGTYFILANPLSIYASIFTAAGDIMYASAASTIAKLAKGSDGQLLSLASGLPSWSDKFSFAGVQGYDSSTSITAGNTLTKTISLGISAKLAFATVYQGSNNWQSIIVTSGTWKNMFGFKGTSNGGGVNDANFNSSGSSSNYITLNSAGLSGTNLALNFRNGDSSSRTIDANWQILAIA